MSSPRRLLLLLVVVGLVALPAIALRAACVGKSCEQAEQQPAPAPFCSLDPGTRALVTAGFYAGRSPDAIAVTSARGTVVTSAEPGLAVPWPSVEVGATATEVPLAVFGSSVRSTARPPTPMGLDQVAPTLAALMGIRRPHPHVRSGQAIEEVTRAGGVPLAVEIVWKGVGMPELLARGGADAPYLFQLLGHADPRDGVAGLATPGSLPLDPAAVLTTIGTGGLPSEHGVTGTVFMGDDGPVRAFSAHAPEPVIAALGDDLDRDTGGAAKIALVADAATDRGLIGGTWYGNRDDATVEVRGDAAAQVEGLLDHGWGADAVPDLVGVTLRGSLGSMDDITRAIVGEVQRAIPQATFVITSTGSVQSEHGVIDANTDLVPSIDGAISAPGSVIAAPASEGLFLDRVTTTAAGITSQSVVDVLKSQTAADGSALFADAFPAFAVQFGRYCT